MTTETTETRAPEAFFDVRPGGRAGYVARVRKVTYDGPGLYPCRHETVGTFFARTPEFAAMTATAYCTREFGGVIEDPLAPRGEA